MEMALVALPSAELSPIPIGEQKKFEAPMFPQLEMAVNTMTTMLQQQMMAMLGQVLPGYGTPQPWPESRQVRLLCFEWCAFTWFLTSPSRYCQHHLLKPPSNAGSTTSLFLIQPNMLEYTPNRQNLKLPPLNRTPSRDAAYQMHRRRGKAN